MVVEVVVLVLEVVDVDVLVEVGVDVLVLVELDVDVDVLVLVEVGVDVLVLVEVGVVVLVELEVVVVVDDEYSTACAELSSGAAAYPRPPMARVANRKPQACIATIAIRRLTLRPSVNTPLYRALRIASAKSTDPSASA